MTRIFRSPAAERDLVDIWYAIALENPRAADGMFDRLVERIGQLEQFPESGPVRADIDPEARALVEGNYLILYRIVDEGVEIVRVVHGARELDELFRPD